MIREASYMYHRRFELSRITVECYAFDTDKPQITTNETQARGNLPHSWQCRQLHMEVNSSLERPDALFDIVSSFIIAELGQCVRLQCN